ncbi:MAG: family 16 glycosylhydrolase, partial [Anaerolineae bacterium]|nr:family 16 glycosylhydrolase [Anaerolineae bacterium]
IFPDDFSGWKFFQIPFSSFARKDWQPGGAPNDGLTLTEVWGYALGFPANAGAQTYYIDDVGLMVRQTVVDEFDDGVPGGVDGDGNPVGFVVWGGGGYTAALTTTLVSASDPLTLPHQTGDNRVAQFDTTIPDGGWGGFTHAFANATLDAWVSQDWSTYTGVTFWFYGANSGGNVNFDIFDNRTTNGDSCERWTTIFPDDFSGWKFFQIPFSSFTRKDWQPGGAPNDGLTLTEVWAYALGFPANVGAQTNYIDKVILYGNTGAAEELEAGFSSADYAVTEGNAVTVAVSLNMTTTVPVTVSYATQPGTATPDWDYTPVSGTLTFAPGVQAQTFTLQTLEDPKYEGREIVRLLLSDAVNAAMGRASAQLNINDDDPSDAGLIDDFDGNLNEFTPSGQITLTREIVAAGSALALPDQGPFENVLHVSYALPAGATGGFQRAVAPRDLSAYSALNFWYYGSNSGDTYTVQLLDNRGPDPGPSGWTLAWSDEFSGTAGAAPDPANWGYDLGGGGWGNNEREYYTDRRENSALDGAGHLVITATTENTATTPYECHYGACEYTSARLLTSDKFSFVYGRAEARLKLPSGQGIWPAFWTLGSNFDTADWPNCGEIDIMENIGREPNIVHGTVHGPGYSGGDGIGGGYTLTTALSEDFHVYAIEWEPDEIRWYVDGIHYFTVTRAQIEAAGDTWVFDHPFFFIMNIAVGGYWPGYPDGTSTFPQTMEADYVRVYQAPDSAERFEATFSDTANGWQQVTVPFSKFSRSAVQPANAPDDGFGRDTIWGYAFTVPAGNGEFYLDQVKAAGKYPILDDFESPLSSEYTRWGDFEQNPGTTTAITLTVTTAPTRTGIPDDNRALRVDYIIAPGGYGGFSRAYTSSKDWSARDKITFWMYGTNSGASIYIDLFDNRAPGSATDTAERFSYEFITDNFTGWRYFDIPFSAFVRKSWQPDGAPDDGLTLTEMWGFAFGFMGGVQGHLYLDDVALADQADLSVTKSRAGEGNVQAGETVTYTLAVVNLGPTDPVSMTLVDVWTQADAIVDAAAPQDCVVDLAARSIVCELDQLDTAQQILIPIALTTATGYTGTLTNAASVTPAAGVVDLHTENNDDSVDVTVVASGRNFQIYLPLVLRTP